MNKRTAESQQASTGIEGLDYILRGGLPRSRTYVVQGDPGVGKTTLGLHFLLAGAEAGEQVLYITLSQTAEELTEITHSHGWSLENVDVLELSRASAREQLAQRQTVIRSADQELSEMMSTVQQAIGERQPSRLVFDSIGAIRVLAGGMGVRYRQEINLLLQLLTESSTTALVLDDMPGHNDDIQFQTLAHGVIKLLYDSYTYADIRMLRVLKLRGLEYMGGTHNFEVRKGGIAIFPRLQYTQPGNYKEWRIIDSGVAEIDQMLGGGLEMGTSCLVVGPTGTGKSSLALLYLHAALQKGEQGAIFLFDERAATFLYRAEQLNMDIRPYLDEGQLILKEVSTGEYSASEFGQTTRTVVDAGVRVIIIDSLTGYYHAMKQEDVLLSQMHEILAYLSRRGVLSLLVVAQHGSLSEQDSTEPNLSYIADTLLVLRLFEIEGEVRRAVSVRKKRHGNHEKHMRELLLTPEGIRAGTSLSFENVLSTRPTFKGSRGELLDSDD